MAEGEQQQEQQQQQGSGEQQQQEKQPDAAALQAKLTAAEEELAKSREQETTAKRYVAILTNRLESDQQQQQQQQQLTPDEELEQFKEAFDKDPRAALDAHLQERVGPLFQKQLAYHAEREKELARMRAPDVFEKYGKEIEEFMEPMNLETRAQPQSWDHAAQFVLSRHVNDIVEAKVKERMAAIQKDNPGITFVEPGGSLDSGNGTRRPQLTGIEAEIAKNFGMSAEEWTKFKGDSAQTGDVDNG